jgi:2-C-methyl-D-erythritol 2,4-cyclodiphosphate synthase
MPELRVGIGVDAHGFSGAKPLILGGVEFAGEPGLAGHSDGDVITHAVIDAVLGAANLGDIGTFFPSDDPQWAGSSSQDLLARAWADVRAAGWELVNADCVLIGERPRLGARRTELAAVLARTLDVDASRMAVRATTTDRLGFTGRGEGLAAQAVALLGRR